MSNGFLVLSLSVALISFLSDHPSNTASGPSSKELIEFLVQQNDLSRLRLKRAEYDVEWEVNRPWQDPPTDSKTAHICRRGQDRYSRFRKNVTVMSSNGQVAERRHPIEIRSVCNKNYSAVWLVDRAHATQAYHVSPANISAGAKMRLEAGTLPDVLMAGYSNDRETLAEMYGRLKDKTEWTIAEQIDAGGAVRYCIEIYPTNSMPPRKPVQSIVVDPERGYSIAQIASYLPDGSLGEEKIVTVECVGRQSIWVATSVEIRTSREFLASADDSATRADDDSKSVALATVKNLDLDHEPPDSSFSIEALSMPDETPIAVEQLDGSAENLVIVDKVPVPWEMLAALKQRNVAAPKQGTTLSGSNQEGWIQNWILMVIALPIMAVIVVTLVRRALQRDTTTIEGGGS